MTDEKIPKPSADIANEFKLLEASSRKLFNLPPYVNPNEFDAWKKEKEDNINKTNLLREQTKTREETYTGRSKYLERLASYSAEFISNTTPVDPSQCAIHGWYDTNNRFKVSGSEVFHLICKECENHLNVPNLTGVNTTFESVKKIYTLYPTFLYTTHNETCFWRYNSCHVSVCAFPLVTTSDAFNLLETQGKLFQKWGSDLPLISNPYDQSKNKIIERIIKSIEHIDVFDFPQQPLTEIQKISYLLPIFGWTYFEEQNYKMLKCLSCFRHIWISNYLLMKDKMSNDDGDGQSDNTNQYHSRSERIKQFLNPIDEHRPYCPWKNTKKARINLKDSYYSPANEPLTGCQWMMEMLFKEWFKLTTEDDKHPKRIEFRRKVEKHISTSVENNKWMTQDLSTYAIKKKLKRTLSESDMIEKEEKINDEWNKADDSNDNEDEAKENVKKAKYETSSENTQPFSNHDQDLMDISSPPPSFSVVNKNNEMGTSTVIDGTMNDDQNKFNDGQQQEKEPEEKIPEEKIPEEKIPEEKLSEEKEPEERESEERESEEKEPEEKEPEGKESIINNTLDASSSSIPSAIDMISMMSPSFATSSPLPTDLLLNDIGSSAILENIQTPDILNDDDLISEQISKVDNSDNNIDTSSSSLEQKQEKDHIEAMDMNKEISLEQKDLVEKENKSFKVVVTEQQVEEEKEETVPEIEKEDEKDHERNIQENKPLDIQNLDMVVNEKDELKNDEIADIQDLEREKEQDESDIVDENNVPEMEVAKEEDDKAESLEEGELNEEQHIQLDHLISEDIPATIATTINEEDESSKLQAIQVENNETIKEVDEKEHLDNEKEENGYVDIQEDLRSTHSDTDMKELLDDKHEKEKETEVISIQDDLDENADNIDTSFIKDIDDQEEQESEYSIIQHNNEEEKEKVDLSSNPLDTEMNELLEDEEKEIEYESMDIQEDQQMENDLINDIEHDVDGDKNKEDEFLDIQEENELQIDQTDADQEMNDLLKNNENESNHEDQIKQDNESVHSDSEMNQLLDMEKMEEKDDEAKSTSELQEKNQLSTENDDLVTDLMNEIEDKEEKQDEDYVDIQVEELQSTHSDSNIKVASSSSSPSLTENIKIIENKNDNHQATELTYIQDELEENIEEVAVEKNEDLDISLSEEEIDKEKLEDEIIDETKDEKEGEEEYDDLQEVLQSDSEKKVLPSSSPSNDEKSINNDDDHTSISNQEVDNNINNDNNDNNDNGNNDLPVENDDLENALVEENVQVIEDVQIIEDVGESNSSNDKVNENGFIEVQEEDIQSTHSDTNITILPNDDVDDEMNTTTTINNNNNNNNNNSESTNEVDFQEKKDIENTPIEVINEKKVQEENEEGEYDHLHEDLASTHSDTEMTDLLGDQDVNEFIQIETPAPATENQEEIDD